MATITQIVTDIIAETSRVDLSVSINRWAKSALLRFHEFDYYPKDRVSDTPVVAVPGNEVTLALPERWRRFTYIAKVDDAGYVFGVFKEGQKQAGLGPWFEVVGNNVILHDTYLGVTSNVKWVYYEYPEITDSTETWISIKYTQEIIDLVNWYLYRRTGDLETARSLEGLANESLERVQRDNLEAYISQ